MMTQDDRPFKLGRISATGGVPEEHRYGDVWDIERATGPERLVIAPSSGHISIAGDLVRELPEPFGLLYVLAVSRTGRQMARYQSPHPAGRNETLEFLEEYRDFLERDGRHHLWVASLPESSTIVYDRHNVIYAYGPLERFEHVLNLRGLTRGEVRFPDPHAHQYHPQYDSQEEKVIGHWAWKPFPLQASDN